MRLLVFLLLIASTTFGQDSLLFDYVNQYRIANGVDALEYDSDLHEISKSNTSNMVINDSLMHSGTDTYECASRVFSIASTSADLNAFNSFLDTYYGKSFDSPNNDKDTLTIDYTLLYVVYQWHSSPEHRKVMLTKDAKVGSCNVSVGDTSFKANYKKIGTKIIVYSRFISHYTTNTVATLNLNI